MEKKIDEAKAKEEQKELQQIKTLVYLGIFVLCCWITVLGPLFYGAKHTVANFPAGVNVEWNLFPKINWQGIDLPPFTSKQQKLPPGKFPNPVPGARLSSPFGYRIHPTLGVRKFHNGQDLAAPTGTPIKSPLSGKIVGAGWLSDACGNGVKITHPENWETAYCHLDKVNVSDGQSVNVGSIIGTVGSTGRSTGPHLHLTLKKNGEAVNPAKYFDF